jgi:hypothetical protein
MDHEGFVFVFAQDVIEERTAGGDFLAEDAALAETGVNQQTKGKREIGFLGEVGDGLRLAVLIQEEIVFGEIVDEIVVLIADGGEEIDGVNVDSDGSRLLREGRKRKEAKEEKEANEVEEFVRTAERWRGHDC